MIGVFHIKSLFNNEDLTLLKNYYTRFNYKDPLIRFVENSMYDVWYRYESKNEPLVSHLKIDSSKLRVFDETIVNTATKIFRRPFRHDGSLNIIEYEVDGESKLHKDGNGRFTGKEYTFVSLIDDGFEGGEFIINDEMIDLELGDALIFQINYLHEIKPVTKGCRVSLVVRLFEK